MTKLFHTLLFLVALASLGACTNAPSPHSVDSANLKDRNIENREGDNLGTVKEVIFDLENGQIRYVIMELPPDISSFAKAAFVPSAADQTAIPWEALDVESGTASLVLTTEDRIVLEAPRLNGDLDALREGWDAKIKAYWQAKLQ